MIEFYAIKDKKVGAFLRPTGVKSIVEVTRQLEQVVKQKDSSLALYPGDFALYLCGKFDDIEGAFITIPNAPVFVAEISSFVNHIPEGVK